MKIYSLLFDYVFVLQAKAHTGALRDWNWETTAAVSEQVLPRGAQCINASRLPFT